MYIYICGTYTYMLMKEKSVYITGIWNTKCNAIQIHKYIDTSMYRICMLN